MTTRAKRLPCADCGKLMRQEPTSAAWVHADTGSVSCEKRARAEPTEPTLVSCRRYSRSKSVVQSSASTARPFAHVPGVIYPT